MIEKLIELTNTIEFYQNGHFHLTNLKGEIGQFKTMEFNFVIEERDDNGKTYNVEHWNLIAHRTIDFKGIFEDLYLPYIKLKILNDHPLLWMYNQPNLECELIKFPENPSEFIGDLFFEYEKIAGNWIPLHKTFWALNKYYKENGKRNISVPKPLKEPIEKVCKKHGVDFKVKKEIDSYDKGYANRPNAKLLIFGNEDASPDNYNLGQPYIIADEFIANKK
ncbi:hypothetical protein [Gillisia limnaea]|uniref:Uncharacterized protein n=1 Tax=Gillisia limnaea (strain DSM 15749 / LMG 21470 / R-8282) TaxID=865937 RepID=H2BXJ6_GILLR|nr:hypothetical protein [Gillisia limnaea]EHQ02078.1 hypothetical protein Gilli_1421 [Gillisia limnaea DSM 15749]